MYPTEPDEALLSNQMKMISKVNRREGVEIPLMQMENTSQGTCESPYSNRRSTTLRRIFTSCTRVSNCSSTWDLHVPPDWRHTLWHIPRTTLIRRTFSFPGNDIERLAEQHTQSFAVFFQGLRNPRKEIKSPKASKVHQLSLRSNQLVGFCCLQRWHPLLITQHVTQMSKRLGTQN